MKHLQLSTHQQRKYIIMKHINWSVHSPITYVSAPQRIHLWLPINEREWNISKSVRGILSSEQEGAKKICVPVSCVAFQIMGPLKCFLEASFKATAYLRFTPVARGRATLQERIRQRVSITENSSVIWHKERRQNKRGNEEELEGKKRIYLSTRPERMPVQRITTLLRRIPRYSRRSAKGRNIWGRRNEILKNATRGTLDHAVQVLTNFLCSRSYEICVNHERRKWNYDGN